MKRLQIKSTAFLFCIRSDYMKSKYSVEERYRIVNEERKHKSVKEICVQYNISRTTFYSWEKSLKLRVSSGSKNFTYRDIQILKEKNKKLENIIEIYNKTGCTKKSTLDEKVDAIIKLKMDYSVRTLCEALGVLRSTYYHRAKRKNYQTNIEKEDTILKEKIMNILEKSRFRLGSKKIKIKLEDEDIYIAPKRIRRLTQEMNVSFAKYVKRKRIYNRKPNNQYFVNRLKQEFTQEKPNKAWVSDTTQIRIKKDVYFLCVVIDLFSRKVIGHKLSLSHDVALIMDTFQFAYLAREKPKNVIFHSDQGVQYTADYFREYLRTIEFEQSFSKIGYPYDNAVVESFYASLKKEEIYCNEYANVEEMSIAINEYIEYYNSYRPHQSLNYKTPEEMEMFY